MNKQCNAPGSTKSLKRFYSIESMGSETNRIVANFNIEDAINNFKAWNYLTVCKKWAQSLFKKLSTHYPFKKYV